MKSLDNAKTDIIAINHNGTTDPNHVYTVLNLGVAGKTCIVTGLGIVQTKTAALTYYCQIDDIQCSLSKTLSTATVVNVISTDMLHFAESDAVGNYSFPLQQDQTLKILVSSTDTAHVGFIIVSYYYE